MVNDSARYCLISWSFLIFFVGSESVGKAHLGRAPSP
jgi:hypothetical protein